MANFRSVLLSVQISKSFLNNILQFMNKTFRLTNSNDIVKTLNVLVISYLILYETLPKSGDYIVRPHRKKENGLIVSQGPLSPVSCCITSCLYNKFAFFIETLI